MIRNRVVELQFDETEKAGVKESKSKDKWFSCIPAELEFGGTWNRNLR